jgi:GDP-L-fucose synthase
MSPFELAGKRVWVAGQTGMVGSAVVRRLQRENCEILDAGHKRLDLLRQSDTRDWMEQATPDAIFLCAARVGGILANDTRPADFLYNNLVIETNVIEAAFRSGVSKLLFLGSSCIYPKFAEQPIREDALLSGALEPTNQWYAVAKIAGLKLCQAYRAQFGRDFISAMPSNLYGPGDNFSLSSSHVIPALMHKAHEAKTGNAPEMMVWGTGEPRREFLHVDDCADALVFLMKNYSSDEHVNVGSGSDIPIKDLARLVAETVGYAGTLTFDRSKPDGTPRKLMSADKIRGMNWSPRITLPEGLKTTYRWFVDHITDYKKA